jgi:hypothetical protein
VVFDPRWGNNRIAIVDYPDAGKIRCITQTVPT